MSIIETPFVYLAVNWLKGEQKNESDDGDAFVS